MGINDVPFDTSYKTAADFFPFVKIFGSSEMNLPPSHDAVLFKTVSDFMSAIKGDGCDDAITNEMYDVKIKAELLRNAEGFGMFEAVRQLKFEIVDIIIEVAAAAVASKTEAAAAVAEAAVAEATA